MLARFEAMESNVVPNDQGQSQSQIVEEVDENGK